MRSKLLSSGFYILITYAFVGIMMHLDRYYQYRSNIFAIASWVVPFFFIVFCLCYRSFYAGFRASVLLALFSYILSAACLFLLLGLYVPMGLDWEDPYHILTIYFFICLALPVPFCYAVWYIDRYIGRRKNN